MPPSKNISFEELSKHFHLPINQVAKELGVCATILKKICRKNGIPRWPHRKIKSLDKLVADLEVNLIKNPQEKEDTTKKIDGLKSKKMEILNNPDILAKGTQGMDNFLKPRAIKMTKTKNNLGHKTTKRQADASSQGGEINCFAPSQGPPAPLPSDLKPSYVQAILSGSSSRNTSLAVSKPEIINTLATLKFSTNNRTASESTEPKPSTPSTPSERPLTSLSSLVMPSLHYLQTPIPNSNESIFNSPSFNLTQNRVILPSIRDFVSRDPNESVFSPKNFGASSLLDLVNARTAPLASFGNQANPSSKLPEFPLSIFNDSNNQAPSLLSLPFPSLGSPQKLPPMLDDEKLRQIRNM